MIRAESDRRDLKERARKISKNRKLGLNVSLVTWKT